MSVQTFECVALRDDVVLQLDETCLSGKKQWILYDAKCSHYYRLPQSEMELLRLLSQGGIALEQARASRQAEIDELLNFLQANCLLKTTMESQRAYLWQHWRFKKKQHWQSWFNPNRYLFFKLSFTVPAGFFESILPVVRFMFSRAFMIVFALGTLLGLLLSVRQIESLAPALAHALTPQGLFLFFFALVLVKIVHECGHALVATYFGCKVTKMGAALMVFWPILFTDTSHAWLHASRRERLWISAAGIIVELITASICLLLWHILPPGAVRSVCLLLATTTWVLSLFVNANPLMRFDGYYFLMDALKIDNLQQRAFEVGRLQLRCWLFGFKESLPKQHKKALLIYCYSAWLYRIGIVLVIGILLYSFLFKLLGIFFIISYVCISLIKPMYQEFAICYDRRSDIRWRPNGLMTLSLWIGAVFLLLTPHSRVIRAPAYQQAVLETRIYSSSSGKVLTMPTMNQQVSAQELVFQLTQPDLQHALQITSYEIKALEWQQNMHSVGFGESLSGISRDLANAMNKQAALQEELSHKDFQILFDGQFVMINPEIKAGDWVQKGTFIGVVRGVDTGQIVAYIDEQHLERVVLNAQASFYTKNGVKQIAHLAMIDVAPVESLSLPYVASTFGGEVPVYTGLSEGQWIPTRAFYRAIFDTETPAPTRVQAGSVTISAAPVSVFQQLYRNIVGVWRRESGF